MVIAAVIVGAHLLIVLGAVVQNDIRREGEEDIAEQVPGEVERCPVVAVLHDVKAVTVEVNVAAEVYLEESLHRNLLAAAEPGTVGLLLEGEVVLHWAPWKLDLLINSRAVSGHDRPECQKQRNKGDETEEDGCLQASPNFPCQVCGHTKKHTGKDDVGKLLISGAICWKRRIMDSWRLHTFELVEGIAKEGRYLAQHTLVVFTPQSSPVSWDPGAALGVLMKSMSLVRWLPPFGALSDMLGSGLDVVYTESDACRLQNICTRVFVRRPAPPRPVGQCACTGQLPIKSYAFI